ncbi:hypothetical protein [Acidisoma cladoniae]|uniref:hypothetical protein n=1 Tax=Acidisoma cladoniae TaxID=3040935 RepID=UPI00254C33DD|nr:hypothetical protein [Acidisoma sp. PAMC 29798]
MFEVVNVFNSPRATPNKARTSNPAIMTVASASKPSAIASVIYPGSAATKRRPAMEEAASGKLTAHQTTRNGQHASRLRNRPNSTARMNTVSI